METIEEYKVVRIVNEEPEFCEAEENHISANFFILCEEGNRLFGKNIYDLQICGMSLLNWVVRVCGTQPKILKIKKGADAVTEIRPYIDGNMEYSVVFYADTPLLNKNHIRDLLAFIDRKRMNVCKFKRGLAFRNDYIMETDEIYSIDEYDFSSNDFFVVDDVESFDSVKNILTKKVIDYHKSKGVFFENETTNSIDANTEIGEQSRILSGACVLSGSKIGKGAEISRNATISGSSIGNFSCIGANSIVDKSIIKDNVRVQENVIIKNSVIGNIVSVDAQSSVLSSSVRDGVKIKNNVQVEECKICENAVIHRYSKVLGITAKTTIGVNSEIGANSEIVDSVISAGSQISSLSKINGRVDR